MAAREYKVTLDQNKYREIPGLPMLRAGIDGSVWQQTGESWGKVLPAPNQYQGKSERRVCGFPLWLFYGDGSVWTWTDEGEPVRVLDAVPGL